MLFVKWNAINNIIFETTNSYYRVQRVKPDKVSVNIQYNLMSFITLYVLRKIYYRNTFVHILKILTSRYLLTPNFVRFYMNYKVKVERYMYLEFEFFF